MSPSFFTMHRTLLLILALIALEYFPIRAQSSSKAPDIINRTDGSTLSCKIFAVDSDKIDLAIYRSGNEIRSFILLNNVSSYIYKGNQIEVDHTVMDEPHSVSRDTIQSGDEITIPENRSNEYFQPPARDQIYRPPLKPWKKPGYSLHVDKQPDWVARLSLLPLGLLFEGKLGPQTTLVGNVWIGMSYTWGEENGEKYSNLYLIPSVRLGPRFYTNFERRVAWGKRVDYFSGNYIGFPCTMIFVGDGVVAQFGPECGFQRTIGRKGYWNISIGIGMATYQDLWSFGLISDFGLGFILSE